MRCRRFPGSPHTEDVQPRLLVPHWLCAPTATTLLPSKGGADHTADKKNNGSEKSVHLVWLISQSGEIFWPEIILFFLFKCFQLTVAPYEVLNGNRGSLN
ncbi:hypothetical protein XENORESO_013104 [Xenotaenia resolanae]|uniref:Uncharacterized protein n=1 Tax=Xenotaenia resolanae TaxID=208358 RepID=A0ABV0VR73_9TELE